MSCYSQDKDVLKKIDSLQLVIASINVTDSLNLAKAHFEIGVTYRRSFFGEQAYKEFFIAEKLFKALKDNLSYGKTLYNIAVIQKNEKDFTASEVTSIEALTILNSLEQTDEVKQYKCYVLNNLGLLFGELGQFEESISYYKKALKLNAEYDIKGSYNSNLFKNNLALSYEKIGEYDLANKYYGEILLNDYLALERSTFYSMVLTNFAHTNFLLKKEERIPDLYFKALKMLDSFNYRAIAVNTYLAEYHNDKNQIDSAKYYAYRAKRIAENYSNDEILNTILLLSKIEEGKKSAEHLREYVRLSDSLHKEERKVRNKFARIRFETKEIEQENIKIARERMWLVIISIILTISALLLYVIITQRAKNKELVFAKQQQEANEEIYNLMLGEHEKIEEARASEKRRISEELHDGVLGRLFGARLSLDSLNMNNSVEAVQTRGQYITELKTIENDIRKVSHELNTDFVSGSGFVDIIKTMVEGQTSVYNLTYTLEHDTNINWDIVTNKYKIHIYRILQESLHNIYKHAQASHVNISITLKNNVICFTIVDNGSGFDVAKAKTGIGLKNMRSRIKEINGVLDIASQKDAGTTVRIEVPIKYD
jgi:signal transduction histidine kinase